ncbi:MAG: T9SS type A sorting domain-containing protein [Bacteroidia bacterium]|nr:T9SS type A sorting domain-containing protein [Bacteroidia bacterium]
MKIVSITLSIILQLWLPFTTTINAQAVYTFDSLNINLLDGQDNWIDQTGQGVATVYLDTTIVNTTNIASPVASIFYQPAYVTRVNDSNFSFPPFIGNETEAIIQFEARGSYVALFALGCDLNNDGRLDSVLGEVGPSFGIWDQHFAIQTANLNNLLQEPFGVGNSVFDWYRIQLRIDFTANGGLGSGSLYYLNLSDGDSIFIPVTNLQSINLQLGNMNINAAAENWNAMFLLLISNGGIQTAVDNLIASGNSTIGIEENYNNEIRSYLEPNFPNPFTNFTTIKYFIAKRSKVRINVFDAQGKKLLSVVSKNDEIGLNEIRIDGSQLGNGVYYYQIESEHFIKTKKMIRVD